MVDFSRLAEQRAREAVANKELDDLPGKGRPLPLAEDSAVPPELRMAYKILRHHGMVPREVELLKRIEQARERAEAAGDEPSRLRELKELESLCLEFNALKQRHAELEQSALPDPRRDRR